jgi:hypothetical protein
VKKRIIWAIIGVLAGVGAIFGGLSQQHKSQDTVYCGSRMMLPGDTCQVTKNGSTTERTYEQQRSANNGEGGLVILGGCVIILISVGSVITGFVRRNRKPAAPADQTAHWGAAPPQQPTSQQPFPQQPPVPQQPMQQQPVQQQPYPQNWSGQPQTPGSPSAPPPPNQWSGGQQPPSGRY